MCGVCGCASGAKTTVTNVQTGETRNIAGAGQDHSHAHDHHHGDHQHGHHHHHGDGSDHNHDHAHDEGQTVVHKLEQSILAKNDAMATRNRSWFQGREILALNLVSSPGAGKTSLLERTIRDLREELPICVIEGDQATTNDAERIRNAGASAVQINTGTGCHLEADMVGRGLAELRPEAGAVVLIENVGNLVCPSLFDLGEQAKVAILSVTEGEDKPTKYPHLFRASDLLIINKIDLLPHLSYDIERCEQAAREVNPSIKIIRLSVKSGEGIDIWYEWLREARAHARAGAFA